MEESLGDCYTFGNELFSAFSDFTVIITIDVLNVTFYGWIQDWDAN